MKQLSSGGNETSSLEELEVKHKHMGGWGAVNIPLNFSRCYNEK